MCLHLLQTHPFTALLLVCTVYFLEQNEELRGVVVTRLLEEMFDLVGVPMLPPPPQLVLAMPRPNDILPSRFVRVCFSFL